MATVNKEIAEKIISNDGFYEDDPRVMRVVEYNNAYGGVSYGIEYEHEIGRYQESNFVRNPKVIFEVKE